MSAMKKHACFKQGRMNPLPFAEFAERIVAPVRLALLELAIKLELPDIIAQTGDVPGIAQKLGKPQKENLTRILDAMAASGLLCKTNGIYRNAKLTDTYLRKGKPEYLGEMVLSLKTMQLRNIDRLKDCLFAEVYSAPARELPAHSMTTGLNEEPTSVDVSLHAEEHWKHAASGLAAYQKAGVGEAMADIAVSLPGAAHFKKMLDLGCGPGVIALSIARRLPGLQPVLCDFPRMLQLAGQEAEKTGIQASFLPGDYNLVDWGSGYDLVWACQSLYYARDLREFIRRIHAALNLGGYFVSIHEGIRAEGTEPAMLVLSRLSLVLEGQDVSFRRGDIAREAVNAGFIITRQEEIPMLYGDADLEVFQKPRMAGDKS